MTTTTCASGMFAPVERRKHHKRKVQRSGPASALVGTGCSNSNYNYNHHHQGPDRTSTARCSNQCNLCEGKVCRRNGGPHRAVFVISAWLVGGGGGCSCMLLLHPILTSADAGPDLCTLCPSPAIVQKSTESFLTFPKGKRARRIAFTLKATSKIQPSDI